MYSVKEPLRRRRSVGSESDTVGRMRQIKRRKMRGCREAECIPSKARSDAAIQSEARTTQCEETDETDEEKAKEREQRSQTDSIGSLLRRRHSVGNESDTVRRMIEIKKRKTNGSREAQGIPSKARSNASVQSIASATESEETDGTEQEKAKEREQRSRMHFIESLLLSRHSVGSEKKKQKEQQSEVKARERKSRQKGAIKRKKCRGCREAECIPSKTCSKATIQ